MKKILVCFLAVLMVLPILLVSCAEGDPGKESQSTAANSDLLETSNDRDDLGEVDLGGRDITVVSRVEAVNQTHYAFDFAFNLFWHTNNVSVGKRKLSNTNKSVHFAGGFVSEKG